ncbi:unknown [Clostridium sp. CAG:354]|nr:unknown [Clostridium sp. CAG:354]
MINFIFSIIYLLVLIGIAIIDKKEHKISKKILLVGFIVEAIQIIFLYVNNNYHLIEYLIYLVIFVILLIMDTVIIRKKGESLYVLQILMLCMYMAIFTDKYIFAVTVIYTLLVIGLYILIGKISTIRKRRVIKKQNAKVLAKLPIGFYLCIADILVLIYSIIV